MSQKTKKTEDHVTPSANGGMKGKHTSRRYYPVYVAAFASLVWLLLSAYLLLTRGTSVDQLDAWSVFSLVAGIFTPVTVIWLVALVFQRTDPLLEKRLEIAKGMDQALAPIDDAEKRLAAMVDNIGHQITQIEASTDIAVQRVEALEDRFQAQINDLFDATTKAEEKSVHLKESLSGEREKLDVFAKQLTSHIAEIETIMRGVSDKILQTVMKARAEADSASDRLKDQTISIESSTEKTSQALVDMGRLLDDQRARLSDTAEDTRVKLTKTFEALISESERLSSDIDHLDERTTALSDNLFKQAEAMKTIAQEAGEYADKFEHSVEQHSTALSKASTNALSQVAQAGEEFGHQADALSKIAQQALDNAAQLFAEARAVIEEESKRAENDVRVSARNALSEMDNLAKGLSEQADFIKQSANDNAVNFKEISDRLADQADMISAASRNAAEGMREMGDAMDSRQDKLGQLLSQARKQFEESEESIFRQRQSLSEATRLSTNSIADATNSLKEEAQSLTDESARIVGDLGEQKDILAKNIGELDEKATGSAARMRLASDKLREESETLSLSLQGTTQAFGEAAVLFEQERTKLRDETDHATGLLNSAASSIIEQTKEITSLSVDNSDKLDRLSAQLSSISEVVTNNAIKAVAATEEAASQMDESLDAAIIVAKNKVAEIISEINTDADDSFSNLHVRFAHALDKALLELEEANLSARKQAEDSSTHIAHQADKLLKRAERFKRESDAMAKSLRHLQEDEFVKASSLIIESLNSSSIDVMSALETDIPDSAWKKYLHGDRGIFARNVVKIGSRKLKSSIMEKFEKDDAFRKAVLKFTHDFEMMMQRVMSDLQASPLSVTLVSSELGKLYVLLSQATAKLNQLGKAN